MTNFTMLSLVLIGVGISVAVVRKVNLHRNGELISWGQAASVVLVRTAAAITVGYLLGVGFAKAMESGLISKTFLLDNKLVAVGVVVLCAIGSFVAFQWIFGFVTKQPFRLVDALKSIGREFIFYGKLMAGLFVVLVLILSTVSLLGLF